MKYEDFVGQLGFSEEELTLLAEAHAKCAGDAAEAREYYDNGDEAFAEYLVSLSEKRGVELDILNLYLYLRFSEDTYRIYKEHGISDDVFLTTMRGYAIVSQICLERTGHYGVAQITYRSWMRRSVDATIFRLGRLEFELITSRWDFDIEVDGEVIHPGDACISVHIPRKERFDETSCETAYDMARSFFKSHYNMDKAVFVCESWLMDPWLRDYLPESSTIINFQKKYKTIEVKENTDVAIGWIFGKKEENIEDYAEDTTIRRAAKERLRSGQRIGTALGARL